MIILISILAGLMFSLSSLLLDLRLQVVRVLFSKTLPLLFSNCLERSDFDHIFRTLRLYSINFCDSIDEVLLLTLSIYMGGREKRLY